LVNKSTCAMDITAQLYPLVADCLIDAEHHDLISSWAEIYAPKEIRIVANIDDVGSSVGVTSEYDNEFYIVIQDGYWYNLE
jgi:hypothetical protein